MRLGAVLWSKTRRPTSLGRGPFSMSARVAAPTVLLIVIAEPIVLVGAPASRLEGVAVGLGVAQKAVRRLGVFTVAGEAEHAAVVEGIDDAVDVRGVDRQVVEVEVVGRGGVQFQSRDGQQEQETWALPVPWA